jgi:D-glycero-alpha-D-manno-heptose-7-phosphate kinase
MIISRTPFRISFFGGGTDYPCWYREHGGAVISTSINKYSYINCRYIPPFFDYKYRIRYAKTEDTKAVDEIVHPSVRECLKYLQVKEGLEIQHNADLPAMSGLGSSSTFTVGLLHTLYSLKGFIVNKHQLAMDAIHVEQNLIKENVGSQDQVCAAFGGLNKIVFGGSQEILVQPITVSEHKLRVLQDHLLMVFTAGEQIKRIPRKKAEMLNMMELVEEALKILNKDPDGLVEFGKLLHEQWMVKRSITDLISNSTIDAIYDSGRKAGAIGGKLLGAGGGGFMLFFVAPEVREKVKETFKNFLQIPIRFEKLGSQIIFYAPEDNYHV